MSESYNNLIQSPKKNFSSIQTSKNFVENDDKNSDNNLANNKNTNKKVEIKKFTNLFEGKIFIDNTMRKNIENGITLFTMGGVNQIGLNMNLYHYKGTWILVDCGSGFTNKPGLDIVVPSTNFLIKNKIKISALFITHLHEDHVGGLLYFFRTTGSECTVYTTKLTFHFLKIKLEKASLQNKIKVEFIESTTSLDTKTVQSYLEVGNFIVRPVALTHSTPGMNAYLISTNSNDPVTVFHTGDWRFDEKPIIGEKNDDILLSQIGHTGVDAIVCDSTNVFNLHSSFYEGDLAVSLKNLIAKSRGTIFVTTFGSNYGRLLSILRAAKELNKKVLVLGKSLNNIMKAAKAAGMPEVDINLLGADDIEEIKKVTAKNELLIVATGCQGEYMAAMSKIARGEMLIGTGHKIEIRPGDTVIFSSKRIPGNEYKLEELYNMLFLLNANVITENDHLVHASGHCAQPELLKLIQLLSPQPESVDQTCVIAVHGSLIHTNKSCDLINQWTQEKKLHNVNSLRVRDGSVINITKDRSLIVDHIRTEPIGVNGNQYISMDSEIMKTRELMQNGIVIVSFYLYKGRLSGFNFACPGYLDRNDSEDLIFKIKQDIELLIERKKFKSALMSKIEGDLIRDIRFIIENSSFNYIRSGGKMPYIEFVYLYSFNDESVERQNFKDQNINFQPKKIRPNRDTYDKKPEADNKNLDETKISHEQSDDVKTTNNTQQNQNNSSKTNFNQDRYNSNNRNNGNFRNRFKHNESHQKQDSNDSQSSGTIGGKKYSRDYFKNKKS